MTKTDPGTEITVVTVAYNSMAVLPDMLASLPEGLPVVIVDNSPASDPALSALADRYGARLVRSEVNRGFGAGCNLGATAVETPFLLFLNPDATVEPGCLEALLAAGRDYPDASAFNPRMLDGKGRVSFKRRSNLLPDAPRLGAPPETDMQVPVLSGAAIFVAKHLFDAVGGFDEDIFLYYEDDDLSLRLRERGPLMHISGAVVRHNDGHSTVRSPETARFKAYHLARSRVFAQIKHGVPRPRASVILRSLLQLVSPLMLNRRKRAKYLGYLVGAFSALKDDGRSQVRSSERL
ncbi:MAG: glycosyltransferase family 2 protein [Pseudomonadota bacterium]